MPPNRHLRRAEAAINRRLRRAEAATYLLEIHGIQRAVSTLAKYAVVGGGSRFRVAGRTPLYDTDGLDEYAESLLSPPVHSTSELSEWRKRRAERAGRAQADATAADGLDAAAQSEAGT